MKVSIHNEEQLKNILQEEKIPAFRYAQIENAIYKNFITDFDKIQTIPKDLRKILKEKTFYNSLEIDNEVTSENNQTTKILFKTKDGYFIESVIMRHLTGRNTLCISCQAGCPMACTFCATGKLWLQKNLGVYEIIEQVPEITHFVAGMGTSGTLMGVSKRLKEYKPKIQIIGIEPQENHKSLTAE